MAVSNLIEVLLAPAVTAGASALAAMASDRVRTFIKEVFRWPRKRSAIVTVGNGAREFIIPVEDADADRVRLFLAVQMQASTRGMSPSRAQLLAEAVVDQLVKRESTAVDDNSTDTRVGSDEHE
jgi:hypothetical protein